MTYSDAIIKRLNDICKERHLTTNKLATLAGIRQSTVRDLVTGKTKNPKIITLHKIATGLNMTVAELLDFKELNEYPLEEDE